MPPLHFQLQLLLLVPHVLLHCCCSCCCILSGCVCCCLPLHILFLAVASITVYVLLPRTFAVLLQLRQDTFSKIRTQKCFAVGLFDRQSLPVRDATTQFLRKTRICQRRRLSKSRLHARGAYVCQSQMLDDVLCTCVTCAVAMCQDFSAGKSAKRLTSHPEHKVAQLPVPSAMKSCFSRKHRGEVAKKSCFSRKHRGEVANVNSTVVSDRENARYKTRTLTFAPRVLRDVSSCSILRRDKTDGRKTAQAGTVTKEVAPTAWGV